MEADPLLEYSAPLALRKCRRMWFHFDSLHFEILSKKLKTAHFSLFAQHIFSISIASSTPSSARVQSASQSVPSAGAPTRD
jgi:hypothetical protein